MGKVLVYLAVIAGMMFPAFAAHGSGHAETKAVHGLHQHTGPEIHGPEKSRSWDNFHISPLASCDISAGHCVVFAIVRQPFRVTAVLRLLHETAHGMHADVASPDRKPETETPPPRA